MRNPYGRIAGAALVVVFGCGLFAGMARAHVNVSCAKAQSKIQIKWRFPESSPPESGDSTLMVSGNPPAAYPPDTCMHVSIAQSNNFDNRIHASGCCRGDTVSTTVVTLGNSEAGPTFRSQTLDESLYAGVGVPNGLAVRVERVVVVGPAPDIVRVFFLGGGMVTHKSSPSQEAISTMKLIVYPNDAAATADVGLTGAGSAFYGAATLLAGSLGVLQGFSLSDFIVVDDGAGTITAQPINALSKLALVPNANDAVVTLVGDPSSSSMSSMSSQTTDVPPHTSAGPWLGAASPNPARAGTRIRFGLQSPGPVSMAIYDQQGRRVRDLVAGALPSGVHDVSWDGRDAEGRQVPSGLYFYRLLAGGKRLNGRVFTLR
jgi:hypothetical protein